MGVANEAGVSVVQLHGPRFPQIDGALGQFPFIRAVAVKADFVPGELAKVEAAAFLLDGFDPALRGGTGKVFDWSVAREAKRYGTIILAGGLTPENVGEAIEQVHPFAVDVATGVECAPGIKDPGKLRAFFAEAARADRELRDGDRESPI